MFRTLITLTALLVCLAGCATELGGPPVAPPPAIPTAAVEPAAPTLPPAAPAPAEPPAQLAPPAPIGEIAPIDCAAPANESERAACEARP